MLAARHERIPEYFLVTHDPILQRCVNTRKKLRLFCALEELLECRAGTTCHDAQVGFPLSEKVPGSDSEAGPICLKPLRISTRETWPYDIFVVR